MKSILNLRLLIHFLSIALFVSVSVAQNTLVIQPNASEGQDAYVFERDASTNFGNSDEFISFAWTFSGTTYLGKSYIKFDLSQLPANAVITSAKLDLYHNSTSASSGQSGSNSCSLKKVTSSWSENNITWNNKPSTTSTGSVILSTSTSTTQDYTNIDISGFVKDWQSSPSTNYGLEMDIINKTPLASMKFCSSDYSVASKRPKLTITYTLSDQNCITLRPDALSGKDAFIFERDPTINGGNSADFISFAWTFSGSTFVGQSLLQFDISQIPANATITDAKLSLYHNPTSGSAGQSGNNEALLKKVTSKWNESNVTWNNRPTTSASNAVTLATSTSSSQDYENIDLTTMTQDWYANPGSNNGVMIDIVTRTPLASMLFCSSDHLDSTKRPKFVICYTLNGTNSVSNHHSSNEVLVYPNPTSNILNIDLNGATDYNRVSIFNSLGKLVIAEDLNTRIHTMNTSSLPPGVYHYTLSGGAKSTSGKFMKMN